MNTAMGSLPLAGTVVLELDRGLAAYAGKMLADLGALVVKVEGPDGAPGRHAEPVIEGRSIPFDHYNTGKRSVVVDTNTDEGISRLRSLIAAADILIDSWASDELARIGLNDNVLGSLRDGLIHLRISPFGDTGPWSSRLGSDVVALAAGGITAGTGYDAVDGHPGRPISPTGGQAAHLSGIVAATLAVAALGDEARSGVRTLDVSQHDVIAVSTEIAVSLWEFGKQTVVRHTGRHASADPFSPEWQFLCADGRYVCAITLYMNDRRFASIVDWFEADGLADSLRDPKFATEAGRVAHMHEITDVMRQFFLLHDSDWIFHEAQRRQIPWARVQEPSDLVEDPQLWDRGFFVPVVAADGTEHLQAGLPFIGLPSIFSQPGAARVRAPELGEDDGLVLGDDVVAG